MTQETSTLVNQSHKADSSKTCITNQMRRLLLAPAIVLVAAVAASACGGNEDSAAWGDDLDTIIDRGWNGDGGANYGGSVDDMSRNAYDHINEYRSYNDEDMATFRDALDKAWSAGSRYDGKAAARAWEESLRDTC